MDEKVIKVDEDRIKLMVENLFEAKEEAEVRKRTEEALQSSAETINDLTTTLEEKQTEFEAASAKIEDLESKVADLTTELEAAQGEKASVEEQLIEATTTIEEMKKDKAAEERMVELEKAGISSGKDSQKAKVRDMTDEEFAAYVEEMVDLRSAVLAELENNVEEEKEIAEEEAEELESKEAAEEETEEAGKENSASEEEVKTPPAEINQAQIISAALNFETASLTEDKLAKYAELRKAMAEEVKNRLRK